MVRSSNAKGAALALLLATAGGSASAAEGVQVQVASDGDGYVVEFELRVRAPLEIVHDALTDYEHLERLSPAIRDARILAHPAPGIVRVRTVTRECVLLLCRSFVNVQDVTDLGARIEAQTVAELSDFHAGRAVWELQPDGGCTGVRYRARYSPKFWMPPRIGRWFLRKSIARQALRTTQVLERAAPDDAPCGAARSVHGPG